MKKIKLELEKTTGKILGYTKTDETGSDCIPDGYAAVIDSAKAQGEEVYYSNGAVYKRSKDGLENEEEIRQITLGLENMENQLKLRLAEYINLKSEKALHLVKELAGQRIQKLKERESLQRGLAKDVKSKTFEKLNSNRFKYYCSICLIIRDENEYLEEWLKWHIGQGVEHFYIYDHGSKQPVCEFLKTLGKEVQDKVTVINFGGSHVYAQHDAYNDCLEKFKYESRWIGFIDSDEMVRIKNGKTLPEYLKPFEHYAGLFIVWEMYGANGQVKKSPLPLRERFTKLSPSTKSFGVGKVFVQPLLIKKMLTHNGYTLEGCYVVDENEDFVDEAEAWKFNGTTETICLDHYYTKSYEEWVEKMKRGSADPQYFRYYEDFFDYNPDMEYCRENIFPEQEYEKSKK